MRLDVIRKTFKTNRNGFLGDAVSMAGTLVAIGSFFPSSWTLDKTGVCCKRHWFAAAPLPTERNRKQSIGKPVSRNKRDCYHLAPLAFRREGVGNMQLTVREVAKLFHVSERKVRSWIKDAGLSAYRVNETYRFNRAELLEWATSRNLEVPPDLFHNGDEETPPASFTDALAEGGIFHGVGGTNKETVLHAVVDAMQLPAHVNRDLLLRVLLAREALGSTGLGDGLAIPHPRNPIVLHVDKPEVCLCFLANPIDFAAIDGKPVHTLFTLVSPTVRDHLHLLSRLAYSLRDTGFKAAVARRASKNEIFREARRVESSLQTSGENTGPLVRKKAKEVA
jgi:PTS system nitrogen regulatory IIA component